MMINTSKPHFTELSCILEVLVSSLKNVLAAFKEARINQNQDIFHSQIFSIKPDLHKKLKLKAIQIQFIISFTLVE